MRNEHFRDADRLSLPVDADTPSGDPVVVGSIIGVTATAEGEGGNPDGYASVWTKGAFNLTVSTTVGSVGLALYKAAGTNKLTTTATANTLFGYALETKGSGDGVIPVKLAQV